MALFTDPELDPQPRRHRLGLALLGLATAGVVIVALLPAPFVIEQPGPVFDTLGTVSIKGDDVAMIQIPDQKTYPTAGTLDMLTVSIRGNPQQLPNWLEIATAYLDRSRVVTPVGLAYPPGVTQKGSEEQGRIDMQNSQKEAIAAALDDLGYSFASTVSVVRVSDGSPADGALEEGDVIVGVDGTATTDVTALRAVIAENGIDAPASVEVMRGGRKLTLNIMPIMSDGPDPAPILGIVVGGDYTFPFDVKIQLENVGGPSAGMMFALGIVDKLSPGELNGGEKVAGTGTISGSGAVGPIGGIRQKMYGAVDAGAEWFLAPAANCDEVTGHIPDGLTVFSVKTLSEATAALGAIESGAGASSLPQCPIG